MAFVNAPTGACGARVRRVRHAWRSLRLKIQVDRVVRLEARSAVRAMSRQVLSMPDVPSKQLLLPVAKKRGIVGTARGFWVTSMDRRDRGGLQRRVGVRTADRIWNGRRVSSRDRDHDSVRCAADRADATRRSNVARWSG
jgi:hypothetical protein